MLKIICQSIRNDPANAAQPFPANIDVLLPTISRQDDWTWQRFEKMHLHFLAASLGAMYNQRDNFKTVTLGDVLRGAEPANSPWLAKEVDLAKVCPDQVVEDDVKCFPKSNEKTAECVDVEDFRNVHQAKEATPTVDGYVNFRCPDGSEIVVFLQHKHRKLTSGTSVSVKEMNEERETLDARIRNSSRYDEIWRSRKTLLVFVTNRDVDGNLEGLADNVVYISRKEMPEHLHVFANCGLLNVDDCVRDDDDA